MTNERTDLLPCPFCGSEGQISEWKRDDCSAAYIICANNRCRTEGPYAVGTNIRNKAARLWNTRTPNKSAEGAIGFVDEMLSAFDEQDHYAFMNVEKARLIRIKAALSSGHLATGKGGDASTRANDLDAENLADFRRLEKETGLSVEDSLRHIAREKIRANERGDAGAMAAFGRLLYGKGYLRAGQASAGGDWPYDRQTDIATVKAALTGDCGGGDLFYSDNGKHADIVDRLRGKVVIPVTDGMGAVGGSEGDNADFFERSFPTSNNAMEAAAYIEKLRGHIKALTADNAKRGDDGR